MGKEMMSGASELASNSLTRNRVSMDKARTLIKQICENDPCAKVEMVVSYSSVGVIESRSFVISSNISNNRGIDFADVAVNSSVTSFDCK